MTLYMDVNHLVYDADKYKQYFAYIKDYQISCPSHTDKLLILAEFLDDELQWDVHAKLHS